VAKLEAVPPCGKDRQDSGQGFVVAPEVRRQLPHDRSQLGGVDERLDALVVAADPLLDVAQTADMGEVAARLGRKQKVVGSLLDPASDAVPRGEAVEGGVHLDGVEDLGVARQPACLAKALGIEPPPPAVVVPARAADPNALQRPIRS
jgi:hypothetical protein